MAVIAPANPEEQIAALEDEIRVLRAEAAVQAELASRAAARAERAERAIASANFALADAAAAIIES